MIGIVTRPGIITHEGREYPFSSHQCVRNGTSPGLIVGKEVHFGVSDGEVAWVSIRPVDDYSARCMEQSSMWMSHPKTHPNYRVCATCGMTAEEFTASPRRCRPTPESET